MNILILLVVLAILILVHEFGHFIVAKKTGIRVDEFGLGFPPKLFGKKYGETEYTFNLIPFGGFVKIFGENAEEEARSGPDSARSFVNKPKWIQAAVISAGVGFNFLLAWILISAGFIAGFPMPTGAAPVGASVTNEQLIITAVEDNSPAGEVKLQAGDVILSLGLGENDGVLERPGAETVQSFIREHGEKEIVLSYKRGEEVQTVMLTPRHGIVGDRPAIGIAMSTIGLVKLPPHRALWEGGKMTVVLTGAVVTAFTGLIADALVGEADIANLAGPVGIVSLVGDATSLGFVYLLGFVAFISINLGVLNLLPIPALDGGRLLFLLIETIKGSPIRPSVVNAAHTIGFALLILLMILVTYNDIARLIAQ